MLREPLSVDQLRLLQVIFEPFDQTGDWPLWQYVELTMDSRHDVDAGDALRSLPLVRHPSPAMWSSKYELVWHQNAGQPLPQHPLGLTVAGLRYLQEAEPLVGAFLETILFLVDQQRKVVPSPHEMVEATVSRGAIEDHLLTASIAGRSGPPVAALMRKLRQALGHEPFLYGSVQQPDPAAEEWTVQAPAALRAYRGITCVDDYLDRLVAEVAPPEQPSAPASSGPLDIPYAVGYLDAVWKSKTGSHLFVNLDPASVARLTLACGGEEEFNSLMSALADVLGQVVVPGKASPPKKGGALEPVRDYLMSELDPDVADRVDSAVGTLIRLRQIRVSQQHSDARHKAVEAFREIGLPFPPPSWDYAWMHIAVMARGALDVIREEVHAGLPQT